MEIKIDSYLIENGIKPSYQRMRIMEYLLLKKNHPTVDMIYQELHKEIPTLSKTTVYNTLKQFVDKNVVKILNIEDNETRFDADTSIHGHFKCIKCSEIFDLDINISKLQIKSIEEYTINNIQLNIKGICKNCMNKNLKYN